MAENKDGMEKSERPSSKRLEDARKKGQVASTREIGSVAIIFGAMGMMALWAPSAWQQFHGQSRYWFESAGTRVLTPQTAYQYFQEAVQHTFLPLLPFILGLTLVGTLAMFVQIGPLWIEDGLKPKLSKLNPINGFKKIFSLRGVVELLKSLFKLGLITVIAYWSVQGFVPTIVEFPALSIGETLGVTGEMAFQLALWIVLVLLALAAADYGYQKWQFLRDQRMTKQEVKDEMKDVEGNPLIRSRRLSLQRDRARQRMMQAVPKADVVITNPTHVAVALKYDPEKTDAPSVVAKGAGILAERIKDIARSAGVPIVENKSLARGLYKLVAVGKAIPADLYKAVAEVLAYVYRVKQGREGATG